jgi:hypothetical protein
MSISGQVFINISQIKGATAQRVIVSDASGVLTSSSVTDSDLGYLSSATDNATGSTLVKRDSDGDASFNAVSVQTIQLDDYTGSALAGMLRYHSGALQLYTTTWGDVGGAGGVPGGSNTQIQYNNSGAFGGTGKRKLAQLIAAVPGIRIPSTVWLNLIT